MASESQKLKQLKAVLAKRAKSDSQNDRVSDSHSNLGPQESGRQVALNATGYNRSALVTESVMPQTSDPEPCGLSKLERLKAALGSSSSASTACQPASAKPSSLSRLEQLKAILEETTWKNSSSPQDPPPSSIPAPQPSISTPPPSIPVTSRAGTCEEVSPGCAGPVVNETCDKRDTVQESVAQTAAPQPSDKGKRLKELLIEQARKKTVSHSEDQSTAPPMGQVASQDEKVVEDVPVPPSCSESQLEHGESGGHHFCPARLPLGTRTPVIFLSIGDKKDVLFVQELFAQHDLVKMVKEMNKELPKMSEPVSDCLPGTFVAVLRKEDSTWYRGLICTPRKNCEGGASPENNGSGDKLRVLFIDYGRTANVYAESLRSLPAVFQRLPAFAIPVTLDGVPYIHLPEGSSFNGQVFDAEVVTNSGLCQSVRLYIQNDNLCLNDTLASSAESAQ